MGAAGVLKIKNAMQRNINDFGLSNTIKDLAFTGINQFALFKVFRGMKTYKVNPKYYDTDEKYTCKFLTPEELIAFSRREEFKLSEEYVRYTIDNGHQCYAMLDGDFLAAYGWYSNTPTIVIDELIVKFHQDYVYGYNVFTHPNYRGQRLNAVHVTRALDEFLKQGFKGVLAVVGENNYRALRSFYQVGSEDFGKIYILKALGKYFIYETVGCKEYGFSVEKA